MRGAEIEDDWICPDQTTPGWDAIDQASWESFPASDPPSFTPTHAVVDEDQAAAEPGWSGPCSCEPRCEQPHGRSSSREETGGG